MPEPDAGNVAGLTELNLVALFFEHDRREFADAALIIDNKDSCHVKTWWGALRQERDKTRY